MQLLYSDFALHFQVQQQYFLEDDHNDGKHVVLHPVLSVAAGPKDLKGTCPPLIMHVTKKYEGHSNINELFASEESVSEVDETSGGGNPL